MDILYGILLVAHFLGLAAIIGGFLSQLRRSEISLDLMLAGAMTQVLSGIAMLAVGSALGAELDLAKIVVKGVIAIVVLGAVIIAIVAKRRGNLKLVKPFFHTAGAFAILNVIVAVAWQ